MKNKIITLSMACLFLLGIGTNNLKAQVIDYSDWEMTDQENGDALSSDWEFAPINQERYLFDEWGSDDAPGVGGNGNSTSGDTPVGSGFLILLLSATGYSFWKGCQLRREQTKKKD